MEQCCRSLGGMGWVVTVGGSRAGGSFYTVSESETMSRLQPPLIAFVLQVWHVLSFKNIPLVNILKKFRNVLLKLGWRQQAVQALLKQKNSMRGHKLRVLDDLLPCYSRVNTSLETCINKHILIKWIRTNEHVTTLIIVFDVMCSVTNTRSGQNIKIWDQSYQMVLKLSTCDWPIHYIC